MIWILLLLTVTCLIALDLGIVHRKIHQISYGEALIQSVFWIFIGLSFAILVYFSYEHDWFERSQYFGVKSGQQAVTEYLTAYLVEKALSLDNLFVIAMIFTSLNIPSRFQHRVLLYGILGAVVFRGIMIFGGISLINHFEWMTFVFGAILIFSALRLLANSTKPDSIEKNPLVRFLAIHLPVHEKFEQGKFFIKIDGKRYVTPLFIAVLLIESADVMFAIDSVPAVITISRDPFIVFSSNIFAILGLRALYFVLASALHKLRYLKLSLILVLFYIGIKMSISQYYHIDTMISLLVISTILLIAILASIRHKYAHDLFEASPLASEFGKVYRLTYDGLKRIIILVIGISVIIIGVIMIFTPGPAIIVIPTGLAILATEFIWARVLLKKFKDKFIYYSRESKNFFTRSKDEHE